jgi:hypothetical protein
MINIYVILFIDIQEHYCGCYTLQEVDLHSEIITNGSQAIVDALQVPQ